MNNKKHKVLASATVMSLLISTVATVTPVKAAEVSRLGGATREITAVEVAKQVFGKADTVVVVNGYGYADAVSATPLAKKLGAPILLTNSNGNDVDVQAIKDLGAKHVYIIGGTGAVSSSLEAKLDKDYSVTRIGGQDRYETNANVAKLVLKLTGSKEAILVSAEGYADALSVASIAAAKGMPVLFANKNEVPAAVKTVANGLTIKAAGGTGVLPESVLKSVKAERITKNAKNRFETNLEVLDYYKNELAGVKKVYMATGGKTGDSYFADALVASAAAAKDGAPVVLTGYGADSTQKDAANKYVVGRMDKDTDVKLVGGIGVLPDSDVKAVEDKKEELNKPVTPVETELKVESVSAVNAHEIKVVFNNELNEESAQNAANYEVFIGTNTTQESTANYRAVLQSDKKTVILQKVNNVSTPTATQPFVVNGQTYKVNVKSSVLDTNYKPVKAYTGAAAIFNDTTAPSLVSATLSGSQLTLEFNERVTNIPSLKVDGKTVATPTFNLNAGSTKVAYTLTDADHLSYGSHNIQLYSVADTAGNSAVLLNGTYEATANNVKPAVSKVEALSTNKFRVTFEAPISTLAASNFEIRKGSYTFANTTVSASVVAGTSAKVWDVTITDAVGTVNPLYGTNETAVSLSVTVKNYKGTNNVFGDVYNTNVTLTKDTVKPVVQNAAINQANAATKTLSIIFNEELDNATIGSFTNGVNASKLAVTHDGVQVAIASATVNATDKKKLDIVLTPSVQDGTYNVTIGADAVRDLAGNTNAAVSTTVAAKVANGDSIFVNSAVITNTVNQVSGQNKITITYPEKMTNTAVDLGNYKLDGVPLNSPLFAGATAGFTANSGKTVVEIVLPKGQIATSTTAAALEYSSNIIADSGRVVIKADKTVYSSLISTGWADDVAPELKSSSFVKATSGDTSVNTIKLTFSESVTVNDVQDFIVTIGGAKIGVNPIVVQNTNKEIVLRLNESVNVNQTGNSVAITLDKNHNTNGVINIVDAASNLATVKSVTLVDSIVDSSLVSAANPGAPVAPSITFDFGNANAGKLMGATTAHEFSLDGGATWIPVTTADQALTSAQLDSVNATKDILVRVKASGLTPVGSIKTLDVLAGPVAPTGLTGGTGKIAGATASTVYQVYSDNGTIWSSVTSSASGEITVAAGSVLVRIPATGLTLPGAATTAITVQ